MRDKYRLPQICQKGSVLLLLVFLFLALPARAIALTNVQSYYDWGPYYHSNQQVLGVTYPSTEKLPSITPPEGVSIPQSTGILPGNPLSPLEHFAENVQLAFTFNPVTKEELRLSIAQERLSEAKTLTDQEQFQHASEAAFLYQKTMATIVQNLETLASNNPDSASQLATAVENVTVSHATAIQSIAAANPPAASTVWAHIDNGANAALDAVSNLKGEPPIPNDLSTSIQALKEQGILTSEESEKIYGLPSRAEVRETLEKLTTSGRFPIAEMTKLDTQIASRYPEFHNQLTNNLQFVELRTYETLPPPDNETKKSLEEWQSRKDKDLPLPPEIRPYLYTSRSEELASSINFAPFSKDQQNEVAKFFPEAVLVNPTIPSETSSPSPTPTPATGPEPAPSPAEPVTPSPSLPPPSTAPYLTSYNGTLPGNTFYFLKRTAEGIQTITTFDKSEKARLAMRFAEERLREASVLAKNEARADDYQQTLEQYRDTMRSVVQAVKTLSGPEDQKQELAEIFESEASRHNIIFEKGLLPIPTENTQIFTDAVRATENLMDVSADTLKRAPLPLVLANRLQDMKAQGLLLPEEVDVLTQSESREEARALIRDFSKEGIFPPTDTKKLDEAQALVSPSDFNQLVEVRKVEELQNLRSIQTDLAQTPTLKNNANVLSQRVKNLTESIDISLIKPEDIAGREDLKAVYDKLAASSSARPINRGQFGNQPPSPTDVVLTACPVGATFKSGEGCVWADSGKKLNDYDQYKCSGSGQYYSFAAQKCVPYERGRGFGDDASPVCPAGYNWAWQSQSCQTSPGGVTPLPIPSPGPGDSESCPQESSYQAPNGCVWDNNGKPVSDSTDYNCQSNQYYSFSQFKCVPQPKPGEDPRDFVPSCKSPNTYWSWSDGKCTLPRPIEGGIKEINIPQPTFVPPGNPFYFVKQWGEGLQKTFAFTPQVREQVSLSQAKERLAEAAYALKKDDKAGVKAAISDYIWAMQNTMADVSREGFSEGAKQEIAKLLSEESVEQNLLLTKLSAWAKEEMDEIIQTATSMPILGVDKAADVLGEPPIPDDIRTKIEALPAEMISEENKKKLLDADSRVAVRAELTNLSNVGGLGRDDVVFLNDDFDKVDSGAQVELEELSKLAEIADITNQKDDIDQKVEKNEDIVTKLGEFQKNFEPGQEIPAEIRPYVRLTRIDEITQTIRPDVVRLEDFQNRKDVQLAVATLQEEFRPTSQSVQQVRDFRRRNPGVFLPPDLARIEALSYNLGVRDQAGPCYLPTPPFPANTPCPAPGASIPIASYTGYLTIDEFRPGWPGGPSGGSNSSPSVDKEGKPLVYGQGPQAQSAGVCPDGYHWMYDSGGWCMSNSGNYSSSYNYTPTGTGSGYTPYSPYYTAPGAPPATYGYPTGGNYPSSPYSYGAPSYYGPAPTNYTTNPPSGTVPGSGPAPVSPGQCPSGFHWMSDSGGWCMSNGNTYVPGGGGGYGGGSGVNPLYPGGSGNCPPGQYWTGGPSGGSCVTSDTWGGYGGTSCGVGPPSSGCGYNSYWDSGSCSCRSSNTPYYGGGGSSGGPSGCYPPPGGCGSGWWDNGSCSCKQASSQGCYNVSASSCGSGFYWDAGLCTCRSNTTSSGGGTSSGGSTSSGSCPSGSHWMSDNGGYCMSDAARDGSTSGGSTTTGGSTPSGSCPSGYHWMGDNGGWWMSDGAQTSSTPTTTTTEPSTSTTTTAPTTTTTEPSTSTTTTAPTTTTTSP
ncbi:MAG: hypothetical protein A2782_03670 [Candidatus Blackburnbacteria bacterium RIFCSPHIGHO2_01_FULL_43_15b]|uniref:DUF5667 domain-containing protein n=1 Tax=Candidatus Blackburnbacteria bacterium RIFCSPHIGHO2_01_FULL_43_15b TaxID=1797513 RepID=A0A1G1UYC8_9BACT|nr:MAG: hypothetical protein A2782_03670 [Candidatus Blackburnbacteria bacterium RIFCSPHIGHO2_01_FULL_43_15b]